MVTRRDNVHHLHYPEKPGTEEDTDLVLLCRTCHEIVHNSIDDSPTWRRADRRAASWAIIKRIQKKQDDSPVD